MGAAVCIGNVAGTARYLLRGRRYSNVPFVGGLVFASGLFVLLGAAYGAFLVPLLLDPGSLPMLVGSIVRAIRREGPGAS